MLYLCGFGASGQDTINPKPGKSKFDKFNIEKQKERPGAIRKDSAESGKLKVKPKPKETHTLTAMIIDGDTIPVLNLPALGVTGTRFKNEKEARKYYRLRKHVRKVYPYAKLAGEKLDEYEDELSKLDKRRKQKRYLKKIEQVLKEEYGDEMKEMTITEGKILIRLIDRETGNTSYELLKDFRGGVSAFFWQSVARVFGHNLKTPYDPEKNEEDRMIEQIIQEIEAEETK